MSKKTVTAADYTLVPEPTRDPKYTDFNLDYDYFVRIKIAEKEGKTDEADMFALWEKYNLLFKKKYYAYVDSINKLGKAPDEFEAWQNGFWENFVHIFSTTDLGTVQKQCMKNGKFDPSSWKIHVRINLYLTSYNRDIIRPYVSALKNNFYEVPVTNVGDGKGEENSSTTNIDRYAVIKVPSCEDDYIKESARDRFTSIMNEWRGKLSPKQLQFVDMREQGVPDSEIASKLNVKAINMEATSAYLKQSLKKTFIEHGTSLEEVMSMLNNN